MVSQTTVAKFIIKGSYYTELARHSFTHGGYGWAINLLINTLEGIQPEQALAICVGTKKLTGDSSAGIYICDDLALSNLDHESIFRLCYRNEVQDVVEKFCKRNCKTVKLKHGRNVKRVITVSSGGENGDLWDVKTELMDGVLFDMIKTEVNGRHYPEWVRRRIEREEEDKEDREYDQWKARQRKRNKKFGGAVSVYGDRP